MSKKPFLLFELLVALSLMGILLSFLFSFMAQSIKVEKKMEHARAIILERQHVQTRLQDLFTSLVPSGTTPALYTQKFPKEEQESLVIFFDHGIDIEPAFSGPLVGRVYIDEKKNLCLAYWPTSTQSDRLWRKEILLHNVSHLAWLPLLPKKDPKIPQTLHLTVQQQNQSLAFAFLIPSSHPIISYERRG